MVKNLIARGQARLSLVSNVATVVNSTPSPLATCHVAGDEVDRL